jgi:hypothetical protein
MFPEVEEEEEEKNITIVFAAAGLATLLLVGLHCTHPQPSTPSSIESTTIDNTY